MQLSQVRRITLGIAISTENAQAAKDEERLMTQMPVRNVFKNIIQEIGDDSTSVENQFRLEVLQSPLEWRNAIFKAPRTKPSSSEN